MRLQYFQANRPPVAALTATPSSGPTPLSVAFDASASSDADGDPMTYEWDLNGDGVFGDAADADPRFAHFTYTQPADVPVAVRVTDSHGASSTATVTVSVANSPPVATILTPASSLLWRVGDEIFFSGRGDDPDEGVLPATDLTWDVILHHCASLTDCHAHHVQTLPGIDHGSFLAPDHSYPSYLEIQLTAKDSGIGWFNSAWTTRRRIQFNNSGQAENLIGFPVLIKLDATNIDYSKTQNAGQDLRFADTDGALLPYQIENWDETGTSYVWVRVPKIDASSSTDSILMYYGNPTAPDAQNPAAVWDSTYAAVWHLGSSVADSTANGNNGVNNGSVVTQGLIGSASQFDGTSWIEVATSPSLELNGQATFEAWVKLGPIVNDYTRIIDKKPVWSDTQGYDFEYHPGFGFASSLGSGDDFSRAENLNLDGQWHFLTATNSSAAGHIYLDGVDRTTDFSISPLEAGPSPLDIGRSPANVAYFGGAIDELRISNVARSPAWIQAEYLSMTGAFTSIGPEEGPGGLTNTTSVSIFPETRDISFATVPTGLQLTVGGATQTTPFTKTVITNSLNSISVPSPQPVGGVNQAFANWSDGGAQSHDIVATTGVTGFTATFVSATCGNGVVDPGEDCDAGGSSSGGCCTALCHFAAAGSTCSDGNACTIGDTCNSTGTCSAGTAAVCNDSNSCTQDTCNPATGCVYNPAPLNGASCSDGNACTTGETCSAGTCGGGTTVVCNDLNSCTQDTCNPASGCVYDPVPLQGASCTDGNICTTGDVCSAGVCGGTPAPDGDADGFCNASDNCPYVANPSQADSGGIGVAIPDGIGNACQCGDLTGDGIVNQNDVAFYRTSLASGVPLGGAAALQCSVAGGSPTDCNILDVAVMARALLGLQPGVSQVCTAALPH